MPAFPRCGRVRFSDLGTHVTTVQHSTAQQRVGDRVRVFFTMPSLYCSHFVDLLFSAQRVSYQGEHFFVFKNVSKTILQFFLRLCASWPDKVTLFSPKHIALKRCFLTANTSRKRDSGCIYSFLFGSEWFVFHFLMFLYIYLVLCFLIKGLSSQVSLQETTHRS